MASMIKCVAMAPKVTPIPTNGFFKNNNAAPAAPTTTGIIIETNIMSNWRRVFSETSLPSRYSCSNTLGNKRNPRMKPITLIILKTIMAMAAALNQMYGFCHLLKLMGDFDGSIFMIYSSNMVTEMVIKTSPHPDLGTKYLKMSELFCFVNMMPIKAFFKPSLLMFIFLAIFLSIVVTGYLQNRYVYDNPQFRDSYYPHFYYVWMWLAAPLVIMVMGFHFALGLDQVSFSELAQLLYIFVPNVVYFYLVSCVLAYSVRKMKSPITVTHTKAL